MNKLLLTTYRKLYRGVSELDRNLAARALLVCSPRERYDYRTTEWRELHVEEVVPWQDSRIFLDRLIRRLNNGSAFYIPPTSAEEVEKAAAKLKEELKHAPSMQQKQKQQLQQQQQAAIAGGSAKTASGSSSTSAPHTLVPDYILPYMSLRRALHLLFERTPFLTAHLGNSMAALKEITYALRYLRRVPLLVPSPLLQLQLPATPASDINNKDSAEKMDVTGIFVGDTTVKPITNIQKLFGLTEAMLAEAFKEQQPVKRKAMKEMLRASGGGDKSGSSSSKTSKKAVEEEEEAEEEAEEAEEYEEVEAAAAAAGATTKKAAAGASIEGTAATDAQEEAESIEHVQLLLSHPRLHGFFSNTIILLTRHTNVESVGFVLNKCLVSEDKHPVRVPQVLRLRYLHPIYSKYLKEHSIMLGGPVLASGTFDESIFLLHDIPNVPGALPLAKNLWLDGDKDVLLEKLDKKEAKPESIVILCGMAGWGMQQLEGELRSGSWVVARGDAQKEATSAFVHRLARLADSSVRLPEVTAAIADNAAQQKAEEERRQQKEKQQQQGENENSKTTSATTNAAAAAAAAAVAAARKPAGAAAPKKKKTAKEEEEEEKLEQHNLPPALEDEYFGQSSRYMPHDLAWATAYKSLGKPWADLADSQVDFHLKENQK